MGDCVGVCVRIFKQQRILYVFTCIALHFRITSLSNKLQFVKRSCYFYVTRDCELLKIFQPLGEFLYEYKTISTFSVFLQAWAQQITIFEK